MVGIVKGEAKNVFTIGCCPLSSHITSILELEISSPEFSEHMIELSSRSPYFFSVSFYIAGIFFPSNIL